MNYQLKNDYSYLFSSLGTKSGSGMGNLNFLSDYASIKNGSYGKLLRAYYNKVGNNNESSSTSSTKKESSSSKISTSMAQDSAKTLSAIDSSADKLKASADALTSKGENSVFSQKEVTKKNEDGTTTTTKEYDMDAIYKAVSGFATNYNNLLDNVNKSGSANVHKAASNMTNITDIYKKSLADVGITIGADKRLSVDEEKLKSADVSKLKSVFNNTPSFASSVSSQASYIDSAASREATKANTYNYNGSYSNNFNMGDMFSAMF